MVAAALGWGSYPDDVIAQFMESGKATETDMLSDATVVITGPTSGIGVHTAKAFSGLGARLVLFARNEAKATELMDEILQSSAMTAKVSFIPCDLMSLDSVVRAASTFMVRQQDEHWPPLKVLVLNAGIYNFSGGFRLAPSILAVVRS